jgi:Methylase involved in ubiquinone/menaquinone biosynthesis
MDKDNLSAYKSTQYDEKIVKTLPFYAQFHQSVIDIVRYCGAPTAGRWLDTGCGTGAVYLAARESFPEMKFVLADPSDGMLDVAKTKIGDSAEFVLGASQELDFEEGTFDVITAIQSHHYLDKDTRRAAVSNCYRMLKPRGLFIVFENILPMSEFGEEVGLSRWKEFQISGGILPEDAEKHIARHKTECFPITISEHIELLNEVGFGCAEVLWASYMQAGFYAVKM